MSSSIFSKIQELFGFKPKAQSALYDFMTSASNEEKQAFLGRIVEGVNEDQRTTIEKAKSIKTSKLHCS